MRSELLLPLVKAGKLRLILGLHHDHPYRWATEEIDFARDMAERTWLAVDAAHAQSDLRTERDQSRSIFDSMTEGFALIDQDWTIVRMNAAGLKLLQREEKTVVGRDHWEAFPETLGTNIETLCRTVREKRIAGSIDHPHTLRNGKKALGRSKGLPRVGRRTCHLFPGCDSPSTCRGNPATGSQTQG